jgi:hypothetical protein
VNLATERKGPFGLRNFWQSLATALLKQNVDPKAVQDHLHQFEPAFANQLASIVPAVRDEGCLRD